MILFLFYLVHVCMCFIVVAAVWLAYIPRYIRIEFLAVSHPTNLYMNFDENLRAELTADNINDDKLVA